MQQVGHIRAVLYQLFHRNNGDFAEAVYNKIPHGKSQRNIEIRQLEHTGSGAVRGLRQRVLFLQQLPKIHGQHAVRLQKKQPKLALT